ncbi:hypothetical protein MICRO80W_970006 [Micrococcus luteus]|nr:hypothetical protein MICRO80W_970006 [Micrococcus luteus]
MENAGERLGRADPGGTDARM